MEDETKNVLLVVCLVLCLFSGVLSVVNTLRQNAQDKTIEQMVKLESKMSDDLKSLTQGVNGLTDCVGNAVKIISYKAEVDVRGVTYKVDLYRMSDKKEQ